MVFSEPANVYRFLSRWIFPADPGRIYALISEPLRYPEWWRGVHLQVEELARGAPDGVGRTVRMSVRSFLPYRLTWELRCVEARKPWGLTSEASGDLTGTGKWTLEAQAMGTNVTFEWNVLASRPLLRFGSFLLRPLFKANHDWVMERFERGLRQELAKDAVR